MINTLHISPKVESVHLKFLYLRYELFIFFLNLLTSGIELYDLSVLNPSSNDALPPLSLHAITESSPFKCINIQRL